MKFCRWCGQTKRLADFHAHPRMKDGRLNKCRDCVCAYVRKWRQGDDAVRERERTRYRQDPRRRESIDRYRSSNPDRVKLTRRASVIVHRAIRSGKLIRPSMCEECKQEAFCEAAHDDYSKPLDVQWLCRRCHRKQDARRPKTKNRVMAMPY